MSDIDTRIRVSASEFIGWRYGKPGYPRVPGGISELRGLVNGDRTVDCSSLTAFVLIDAVVGEWTFGSYKDLQVYDATRPMSPIDAVVNAGAGRRVSAPSPGRWHLMQTWKRLAPLKSGHSRLVRCADDGDTLTVLESTNAANNIGPRWADMSWAQIQSRYEAIGLVCLEAHQGAPFTDWPV